VPAQPRRIALVRRFSTNEGDLMAQVRAVGIVLGKNQGARGAPEEPKAVSHKSEKMRNMKAKLCI